MRKSGSWLAPIAPAKAMASIHAIMRPALIPLRSKTFRVLSFPKTLLERVNEEPYEKGQIS